ncbi:ABC transporter permease [Nakamurella flavida]|uniref:ABC transporter permease n=1 Tax=Nakamurella flavida TaxID=363630 RepID=A0A938YNB6_9ACTN|nr:ABC transporter permease [Nakamurella flavida]MBM9477701.1 ABC transporter permease [Nakamurella flavida]MDP9779253.1 ABC-type dipeptide/oligopeptide/nickel transport system permease subunit [Nakamurella flavida]
MTDLLMKDAAATGGMGKRGVWPTLRRRPLFWACAVVVGLLGLLSVLPGPIAGLFGNGDPRDCDITLSADAPSSGHPFGTDLQGCDIYSNVIYGARTSLSIGLLCTAMALLVAIVVGTLAGYRGGWLDGLLSRLTDVFLGFPFILGAIVVLNSTADRTVLVVSAVLALFSWPTMARLIRSSVRQVRDAEFVHGARAMGLPTSRILLRYILPNAIGPVLAVATIMIGSVIVAESTLTFLGVGLQAPSISWGLQLASAQARFQNYPYMLLFPSLFLSATVIALIALGDLVRDALDPRTR